MIVFNYEQYIKKVKREAERDGIKANDIYANNKIDNLLLNMISSNAYEGKKGKIIGQVAEKTKDYYKGLPMKTINKELRKKFDEIKAKGNTPESMSKDIEIVLYESEMERIARLPEELQDLAFSMLVVYKFKFKEQVIKAANKPDNANKLTKLLKLKAISECNADIFYHAKLDTSGTKKDRMIKKLVDEQFVRYTVIPNKHYSYKSDWIVFVTFQVYGCVDTNENRINLIRNIDNDSEISIEDKTQKITDILNTEDTTEKVFMKMTNFDDILLYLKLYRGDDDVKICKNCGAPILKTGNAKKLCSVCKDAKKRENNMRTYRKAV